MRILLGCGVEPFHRRTCDLMHDWQLIHWMRIQHIYCFRIYESTLMFVKLLSSVFRIQQLQAHCAHFIHRTKTWRKKKILFFCGGIKQQWTRWRISFRVLAWLMLHSFHFLFLEFMWKNDNGISYITHGRCVHGCRHLSSSITRTWKCSIVSKIYLWEQMNI